MKSIKYILFISLALILFASCEKNDINEDIIILPEEEPLDITDMNISGEWSLAKLNGSNIDNKNDYF